MPGHPSFSRRGNYVIEYQHYNTRIMLIMKRVIVVRKEGTEDAEKGSIHHQITSPYIGIIKPAKHLKAFIRMKFAEVSGCNKGA
jgi:hypothetical protein